MGTCILFSIQNSGLTHWPNPKCLLLVPANLKYLVIFLAYSYFNLQIKHGVSDIQQKMISYTMYSTAFIKGRSYDVISQMGMHNCQTTSVWSLLFNWKVQLHIWIMTSWWVRLLAGWSSQLCKHICVCECVQVSICHSEELELILSQKRCSKTSEVICKMFLDIESNYDFGKSRVWYTVLYERFKESYIPQLTDNYSPALNYLNN